MSQLESAEPWPKDAVDFSFRLSRTGARWRWVAYDPLGRVADAGEAATKAEAAACLIRSLART